VSSRLARARQALAARLKKRGVTLSVPVGLALGTRAGASAPVPEDILSAAVDAAVGSVSGCPPGGVVIPAAVPALKKGVLYAMLFQRLKRTGFALLLALGLCAGAAFLQPAGAALEGQPAQKPATPDDKKPAEAAKKVSFTIKDATIEELDDRYSLVT